MLILIAKYHVKPRQLDQVLAELRKMKPLVLAHEPGCKLYQVSRSTEHENLLVLYEHYDDEAALDFHRQTPHFKTIIEGAVVPMLERREREFFELVIP